MGGVEGGVESTGRETHRSSSLERESRSSLAAGYCHVGLPIAIIRYVYQVCQN